ncbi:MAG: glycosyltransferase family 4 protein [Planctomyces sp.]|nr:glycosyltransferase family 4 protein [Planctomyces sp.]
MIKPPLIIAEAANPEWASVPLVGWSHARILQSLTGAHLVTQIRNREAILRAGLTDSEFTAIDSEAVAARIHALGSRLRGGAGKGWTTIMALSSVSYSYFERLVWKKFEPDLRAGKFSLVHRITPLSPTVPSSLAARCRKIGIPFVLGPLNGGVPWPQQFNEVRRAEREWLAPVRSAYKWLPGYRSTLRNSDAIVCGSSHTAGEIPDRYQNKVIYIPENGIDPTRFVARRCHRASLPLRCIFLGRLVPYKGVDLLIEAIAPLARSGKLTLDIVGDGPQFSLIQERIGKLGIQDAVRMIGSVPHHDVQNRLAACDILTFPSVREFGGGVILESMAVGVVPMAVDYAGPSELMTESTSFRIPLGTRDEIIQRYRNELERLISDPGEIDRRSGAALERAYSHFTWERKGQQSLEVYRWVLGMRPDKPQFNFA